MSNRIEFCFVNPLNPRKKEKYEIFWAKSKTILKIFTNLISEFDFKWSDGLWFFSGWSLTFTKTIVFPIMDILALVARHRAKLPPKVPK
jgi:hypothetical protein